MIKKGPKWVALGIVAARCAAGNASAAAVLTQHNDEARTGANLTETGLTPANVNTNTFGLLCTRPVDDQIYAQPLVMTNVAIPGKGAHNVVFICTVNDSVYAFDADDPTVTTPYWTASFINPPTVVPPRNTDLTGACGGDYPNFTGNIGIVGTPVIDPVAGTIYMVARTKEHGTTFVQRLHALDITTGLERTGSPVTIAASYPGNGSGSVNNNIAFDPFRQNQRAGLALVNGTVYIAWTSHCDWSPYHGWVMGYDATTLKQTRLFNDTPNGDMGGIWMSGQAPAIDTNGNLYVSTGNGSADATGAINHGMSFLKLTPNGSQLTVASWFQPYNWSGLNDADLDLGSGGVFLIPGTSLLAGGGKGGTLYVVNRDNMGGLSGSTTGNTNIIQYFMVTPPNYGDNHIHGAPVWWDGPNGSYAYVWGESDYLRQYQFNRTNGKFTLPNIAQSPTPAPLQGMPGGALSVSANGSAAGSGIIWASHQYSGDASLGTRPGILRAYNAENVGTELWNSEQLPARDSVGEFAKYVPPTVVNGKVYLATFSGRLNVYGILPQPLNSGAPQLFQPPLPSSTKRYAGTTITYSVPANGAPPISYQWFDGTNAITGATGAEFTITSLQLTNSGAYYCRLSNALGSTNSPAANLTVIPAPDADYPQAIIADRPIAYWRLDETNGSTVANDFAGGCDGTYFEARLSLAGFNPANSDGAMGVGPAYNPSWTANGGVSGINGIDFSTQGANGEFSVEAWVRQNAQTPDNGIVASGIGGNEQFCLSAPGGNFKFFVRDSLDNAYETGTTAGNDTNWHHVAGVVDQNGGTVALYVDGAVVSSVGIATGTGIQAASTPVSIGARQSGWVTGDNLQLNAAVSDVAIYDYPLSAAQAATHYAIGINASTNNGTPVIITQPTGGIFLQNASATFTVSAIGQAPLTYQWRLEGTNLVNASGSRLTLGPLDSGDAGNYSVVVTSGAGLSVTSAVAIVEIIPGVPVVLDPTGAIYTGISASSVYSADYAPSFLFSQDVTGIPLGVQLSNGGTGVDWAANGTGPDYLAFQVDKVYSVQSLFYAQRVGGNLNLDKVTQIDIWTSPTTAFNPQSPPTNAPAAVVPITTQTAGVWTRYLMSAPVTGKYFLMEIEENPPEAGGNIGGDEFRLGVIVPAVTLQATQSAGGLILNWPSPGRLLQAPAVTGPWTPAGGITPGTRFQPRVAPQFYRVQY